VVPREPVSRLCVETRVFFLTVSLSYPTSDY
jgi:hypothetical protein